MADKKDKDKDKKDKDKDKDKKKSKGKNQAEEIHMGDDDMKLLNDIWEEEARKRFPHKK